MVEDALKRFLPIFLLTGCVTSQTSSSAFTVSDVWARHHELDGKAILVEGVVTECRPLGCPLQETAENQWKWVSIGTSDTFDRAVASFLGKRIIVQGRLRADCLHIMADTKSSTPNERGEVVDIVCTDRASMIMHPKLISLAR